MKWKISDEMTVLTKLMRFAQKNAEKFCSIKKKHYLCTALEDKRAFSSAGLERLPYKQRVGGSNPSTPTTEKGFASSMLRNPCCIYTLRCFFAHRIVCGISHCLLAPHANMLSSVTFLTNPNRSLGHELIAADHLPRCIKAQAARQIRRIYPAITPCLVTNYAVFGLQLRRICFPFCC